jgi:hypothetical protein
VSAHGHGRGSPPPLTDVQRWFHAVITHPEGVAGGVASPGAREIMPVDVDRLELVVARSRALSAADRLAVYANAYFARLLECLGELFPALRRALGNDVFDAFAVDYLGRHPPHSYTLDRLGADFPSFLEATRPDLDENGLPPADPAWPDLLVDLARLELAIAEVFDGPGVESDRPLTADDLAGVTAASFAAARIELAPCVRLLAFRYPVNTYYTALRRSPTGEEVPPPGSGRELVALTRRDYVVRRHVLTEAQFALLAALADRRTVEEAVAVAAATSTAEVDQLAASLHAWFAAWTAAPMFSRILPAGTQDIGA